MAIQARLYADSLSFPFIGEHVGENPSQSLIEHASCLDAFYFSNLPQQQQQQRYQNQDLFFDKAFVTKSVAIHSPFLAAHLDKENQEIEKFINLQNERLRLAIQSQIKQQMLTILTNYESQGEQVLRQKDEEIKRATTRRLELEDLLRRIDNERQKWQMIAAERETMVVNLNKTIEQVNENIWKKEMVEVEDEEYQGSCCNGDDDDDDEKKGICKSCFKEESCVVMLPCRHMCLCKSCDVFLRSCPVCNVVKKATIQVSFEEDFHL